MTHHYQQSVLERVLPLLEPDTFVEVVPEHVAVSMDIPTPWVLRALQGLVDDGTLEVQQNADGHPEYRPSTSDLEVAALMRQKGARTAEQQHATGRP